MKIIVFSFFYLLFSSFILMGFGTPDKEISEQESDTLQSGVQRSYSINHLEDSNVILDFEVPEDAWGFDIKITGATGDVDIYLYNTAEVDTESELFDYSESSGWNESMRHIKFSKDNQFATGPFTLYVEYGGTTPRVEGLFDDSEIDFDIEYNYYTPSRQRLSFGENNVKLLAARSMLEILPLEIPDNYRYLPNKDFRFRIDVLSASRGVDIFVVYGSSFAETGNKNEDIFIKASTSLLRESLVYNPPFYDEEPFYFPAGEEEYFLIVEADDGMNNWPVPPETDFDSVDVNLFFSWGLDVPSAFPDPPDLSGPEYSAGKSGWDYGIRTVQVFTPSGTGSGGVVSPDGYIITNNHVVLDDSGGVSEDIHIGVSRLDFRPVEEWFSARVVERSPVDDLALLKITGDRWNRPLPEGYGFSYWEIGSGEELRLGDEIIVLGYPGLGGDAHSNLVYSRGSVSGGQYWNGGLIINTDALVSPGSSGGVALNAKRQMVGVPFHVTFDFETGGNLGQVIPVERIPEKWRKMFRN